MIEDRLETAEAILKGAGIQAEDANFGAYPHKGIRVALGMAHALALILLDVALTLREIKALFEEEPK